MTVHRTIVCNNLSLFLVSVHSLHSMHTFKYSYVVVFLFFFHVYFLPHCNRQMKMKFSQFKILTAVCNLFDSNWISRAWAHMLHYGFCLLAPLTTTSICIKNARTLRKNSVFTLLFFLLCTHILLGLISL